MAEAEDALSGIATLSGETVEVRLLSMSCSTRCRCLGRIRKNTGSDPQAFRFSVIEMIKIRVMEILKLSCQDTPEI